MTKEQFEQVNRIRKQLREMQTALDLMQIEFDILVNTDWTPDIAPSPSTVIAAAPVVPPVAIAAPASEPAPVVEPLIVNDEWKGVLDAMTNGTDNLFITGNAGSGKSTMLGHFIDTTPSVVAVVAPTGVAALRVGGMTIHGFFGFGAHALDKDDTYIVPDSRRAKYKALDILIIDEISMVRADLMDAVDKFLRKNGRVPGLPFGGCRIIMFGDLFQLPPVSKDKEEKKYLEDRYGTDTPYFFHAECWRNIRPRTFNLTTIFRQKDPAFTEALNAIRRGETEPKHMMLINSRVKPAFQPTGDDLWLTLTTTNDNAKAINDRMLAALTGESKEFEAQIDGDFDLRNSPTEETLELKVGATVMFVRNNKAGGWVNGTIGKVAALSPLRVNVDGVDLDVDAETWEQITYEFDNVTKKLKRNVKGKFIQIPLKLAAAITVHRSQGVTLDRVIIDLGFGAFAAGQTYVALSRCRSLDGIVLRRPIQMRDLITSPEVQAFMAGKPIAAPKLLPAQMSLLEAVTTK